MGGPLIDKSFAGMIGQMRRDITELQRRLTKGNSGSGSTVQRNLIYGIPGTDDERVALANRQVSWYNTDTGWTETYYAVTGLPGLGVKGLVPGVPSAWYPVPGSLLTATRIHGNAFHAIPGGVTVPTMLAPGLLVNIGGFSAIADNGLTLPFPGYYGVAGSIYYSGGGVMGYVACIIQESSTGVWRDLIAARTPGQGSDVQPAVSAQGILFPNAATMTLMALAGGAQNTYGDGVTRRTFIGAKYEGPALVGA